MLSKGGVGTLVLSNPNNSYSGGTAVSGGGTLSVSADGNLGLAPAAATPNSIVLNNGTLLATAGFTLNSNRGIGLGSGSGAGTGTINVPGGNLVYGGVIANNGGATGSLKVPGAGTLTLNGQNTYSGGTTISGGGTLSVGIPSATGTGALTLAGGTLAIRAVPPVPGLAAEKVDPYLFPVQFPNTGDNGESGTPPLIRRPLISSPTCPMRRTP